MRDPVGRGQREMIIGRTSRPASTAAIALDTIMNQKRSTRAGREHQAVLRRRRVGRSVDVAQLSRCWKSRASLLEYSIIVARHPPPIRRRCSTAAFTGCTMGELLPPTRACTPSFIYDDLSKEGLAYRQGCRCCCAVRRGRDIAAISATCYICIAPARGRAKLNKDQASGSLTRAAYHRNQGQPTCRPTLRPNAPPDFDYRTARSYGKPTLFFQGIRPRRRTAVCRFVAVGSFGSDPGYEEGRPARSGLSWRQVPRNGGVRGSSAPTSTPRPQSLLNAARRLTELLKQPQFAGRWKSRCVIWAATNGYLDALPLGRLCIEAACCQLLRGTNVEILNGLRVAASSDDLAGKLKSVVESHAKTFC